jgi:uncharacterized protein YjbJ (UPF0337 family)
MNANILRDNWGRLKGPLRENWNKLTATDLAPAAGSRRYLVGRLQERYGWRKEKAEQEYSAFERTVKGAMRRSRAA